MKHLIAFVIALAVYIPAAHAQKTHEIDINLSSGYIWSYKLGNNGQTDINLIAAYSHYMQNGIQAYVEGGISSWPDGADLKTLVTILGGAVYNFQPYRMEDSMFALGAIGLGPAYDEDDGEYSSEFTLMVGAGKRFDLFPNVAYKPQVRIAKRGEMDVDIRIEFLNLALMF